MKPLGSRSRGAFFCLFLALTAASAGCKTLETAQRESQHFADGTGLSKRRISTSTFTVASWRRIAEPGAPLRVYIEGDGVAFRDKYRVSPDPTPAKPMMMALAVMDPSPNVAYLARPCQYDDSAKEPPCEQAYWTDRRFSEEVIASTVEALDSLKNEAGASKLELVGYSGGAAVAVLAAERRRDVASIRTIAGNLDPDAVNRHHHVPLFKGSLDPLRAAPSLAGVPQRHFTGMQDRVVPPQIAKNFVEASGGSCAQITPVEGASHHDGWVERWKLLLKLPVSCGGGPA